ncbi:DUF397 domain-containing protein [Streptomyces wuyuanensis]|uniref:DUF397 domain-containing protein n=1 Tax=Streptomyces wuyuanensis TaxID=1196353 RepID=UPI003715EF4E
MRSSEHVVPDTASIWRKSSYSGGSSGDCLEIGESGATCVPVRDSKNPHGPALVFGPSAWTAFVGALKANPFDRS